MDAKLVSERLTEINCKAAILRVTKMIDPNSVKAKEDEKELKFLIRELAIMSEAVSILEIKAREEAA